MRYRRTDIEGGCYFFTVNLANRRQTLLIDHVEIFHDTIRRVKHDHPFRIDAMVILPDHLHAIWTLPPGDRDYSIRWSLIKAGFSRRLPAVEKRSPSRQAKGERGIWQRRFWEHLIRDEDDFSRHMDYIHINPVKHGYVSKAAHWPYSSLHRYVRLGVMDLDWASGDMEPESTGFGER